MRKRFYTYLLAVGIVGAVSLARAEMDGFEGVTEVRLELRNDVPVLLFDGDPSPPVVFFFNNSMATGPRRKNWEPQAKMAGEAGVHIYSFDLAMPPIGGAIEPSMDYVKAQLGPFIEADPWALFIPRINVNAPPSWLEDNPSEQMVYPDGSRGIQAIASERWKNASDKQLTKLIALIEASSYAPRFIGYHIGGQDCGEWFPQSYREKGPDIGEANSRGFRAWLKAKYEANEAFRKAWGDSAVDLATVGVPVPEAGRFPIRNVPAGTSFDVFYRLPEERKWVDYSRYTSELTATRVIEFARLVKEVTDRKKLAVSFYGYNMDLPASVNGHTDLMRVLECPDIDALASPMVYWERLRGEGSGFMTTVDSYAAHGKLWIVENDMRSHRWTPEYQPKEVIQSPDFQWDINFMPRPRDARETVELLKRDFWTMLAHRCGTWWMDLTAVGAFREQVIWDTIGEELPSYKALYASPFPYEPEVAVLVDESSRDYEKSDWDISKQALGNLRYEMGLSGTSFGLYLLGDFINGQVPSCKAYIFANAFCLDAAQIDAIRDRLEHEGATAVWIYAPGYLDDSGVTLQQAQRLTGMRLVQKNGRLGSYGVGSDAAMSWGVEYRGLDTPKTFTVSPRLVVQDETATILGRYMDDSEPSLAIKRQGQATHVFIGDFNVTAKLLRRVLRKAHVHFWTNVNMVVQTDGSFLAVHAKDAGVYPIYCPDGVTLESLGSCVLGQSDNVLHAPFNRAETRTFRIHRAGKGP